MRAFAYERVHHVQDAVTAMGTDSKFLAGGTNLLDLMKGDVERPVRLVDINRLPLADVTETAEGGLRIGALVRNSDCAEHRLVRERYPLLAEALLAGASPQLRNMATVGGNLLQRTRCYYFYDNAFPRCNKRDPGTGCDAREGFNRIHAILGASEHCVATHPSDMAVALAALDASIEVLGRAGVRRIAIEDFHRLPGDEPHIDTQLHPDELITGIDLPSWRPRARSHYLKIRDRASYAFALVSVAVNLEQDSEGITRHARIAFGGVAHKPWRARSSEGMLVGERLDAQTIHRAAAASVEGAQPLRHNAFKVELAQRAVARALEAVGATSA